MKEIVFPQQEWEKITPFDAGLRLEGLEQAKQYILTHAGDKPVHVVIVKAGRIVLEWKEGGDIPAYKPITSAGKSIFSNILGIVIEEKKLNSADEKVIDHYPEMMDVPEGEGPTADRYARDKDGDITFRQLISNTSGYLIAGQSPGKHFLYSTDGMNILTHALGKIYHVYETAEPEQSLGFKVLIEFKIGKPIGANFQYHLSKYNWCGDRARLQIFSNYCHVRSTIFDLARLGWLWCNMGNWDGTQIIPQAWMRESIQTNPDILANCPRDDWKYGYGYWTNNHGVLWPSLPRSVFSAWGGNGHFVTCFPESDLVIVQSTGPFDIYDHHVERFLKLVLESYV